MRKLAIWLLSGLVVLFTGALTTMKQDMVWEQQARMWYPEDSNRKKKKW